MQKTNRIQKLFIPSGKLREAMELYPGKTRTEVESLLWVGLRKKLLLGGVLTVLFLVSAGMMGRKAPEAKGIVRPSPGSGEIAAQVLLNVGEEWKHLSLAVGALEFEEAQIEELHRAATVYLAEIVPGENESLAKVTEALCFPETLPEGEKIYWSTNAPWLVTAEGEVLNENLQHAEEVVITAEISYGSERRYFSETATIYPAVFTGEEAILREVQAELKNALYFRNG